MDFEQASKLGPMHAGDLRPVVDFAELWPGSITAAQSGLGAAVQRIKQVLAATEPLASGRLSDAKHRGR
jgi:hypothetical protein